MGLRAAVFPLLAAAFLGAADPAYVRETEAWRGRREDLLKAEDGWLAVAGLFWLEEGTSTVGSAPGAVVRLPEDAPPRAGLLERRGPRIVYRAEPGVPATSGGRAVAELVLRPDTAEGGPDRVTVGRFTFFVIERGGRLGVRLRDPGSPRRRDFAGLRWYPVDEAYRVTARFLPHPEKRTIAVPNVLGTEEAMAAPGVAVFTLGGRELRLHPVLESPGARQLFFIFKDETAPRETYGGGRFLYAALPVDGKVELDFNRAYTPPCAFTAFATCPLPPRENRLAVRIPAGEKTPPGSH